jgi:GR25 family glycosyltransferase involved in LPS biosynthesis
MLTQSQQKKTDYQFYCLSYNNPERKENMKRRFESIGVDCFFYKGVAKDDSRINGRTVEQRVWSCMYGHLDMIHDFYYNTNKLFGIFCEDDLYIHKDLEKKMPKIMFDFMYLKLDVLLLGYLLPFKIEKNVYYKDFQKKNTIQNTGIDSYHDYPNDVWGTQMYMLSRSSAKKILDKYSFSSGYADKTIYDDSLTHFSADWTITKDGNRALIFPMLAVEDNQSTYDNEGQHNFHNACFQAHFVSDVFII